MVFFKDIPVAIEFCRRYQNFFLTISEHSPYKEDCGLFNTILSGRHSRNCVIVIDYIFVVENARFYEGLNEFVFEVKDIFPISERTLSIPSVLQANHLMRTTPIFCILYYTSIKSHQQVIQWKVWFL